MVRVQYYWHGRIHFQCAIQENLIILNFLQATMENGTIFYKDVRFWLVFLSLITLVSLVARGYPL